MLTNPLFPITLMLCGAVFLLAGYIFILIGFMKGNTGVSKWHLLWPVAAGFFMGPAVYIRFFL